MFFVPNAKCVQVYLDRSARNLKLVHLTIAINTESPKVTSHVDTTPVGLQMRHEAGLQP